MRGLMAMELMAARMVAGVVLAMVGSGCVGNTGGDTFAFPVAAAGPADATAGQPFAFTSAGFTVTLTEARLHVGAVYLNQSAPVSGAQATGCYLTGTYVGEQTSALDVDLLNPTPQPFPAAALGVTEPPVKAEQVWLTGGDINAPTDTTTILAIAGSATGAAGTFPFTGHVTIGANHVRAGSSTGGGDAICRQRIVTPIEQPITLKRTGGLLLRIDPRAVVRRRRLQPVAGRCSQRRLRVQRRPGGAWIQSDGPGTSTATCARPDPIDSSGRRTCESTEA